MALDVAKLDFFGLVSSKLVVLMNNVGVLSSIMNQQLVSINCKALVSAHVANVFYQRIHGNAITT